MDVPVLRDWTKATHMSVVERLREWGSWGAANNISYPTMSPMFGERALKTPMYAVGDASPDVLEVDAAVRKIGCADRALLLARYQLRMHWKEICDKNRWSKSSYFRNIEEAHESVKKHLDQ